MRKLNMKLSTDKLIQDINGTFIDLSEYSIDTIINVYLIDYLSTRKSINYYYSLVNRKLYLLMPLLDITDNVTILLDFFSVIHDKEINKIEFIDKTLKKMKNLC